MLQSRAVCRSSVGITGKEVEEKNQTVEGIIRKTEVDTENFTDEVTKRSAGDTKTSGSEGISFYK